MAEVRSILIADDNSDVRDALAFALRAEGYRVRAARDAYEAQRMFASSHPDIVLSDIRMPGDGMTLLRRVHDMSPETPVILMTGFEQPDDRKRALAGGAKDLLVKPVVGERLRNALRRVFDRRRTECASDAAE
jgi:CheY-like chemotaxis protein